MRHYLFALFFIIFLFSSCDDTTETIGSSLSHDMDNLSVMTDTFAVTSRSLVADSVYSRTSIGYLGKVKDPETNAYISGNFMTQFHVLEDYSLTFPASDSIVSRKNGKIIADSCELRLFYTGFYGDSLATMKMTIHEMSVPMYENQLYYSSFDPIANGYIRGNGMHIDKSYSLTDMSLSESQRSSSDYSPCIRIPLNDEYTDKNGNVHENFGTYLMNAYYENPSAFGNSYKFMNDILPGFYFEHNGGLGSMAYITLSRLNVYFRHLSEDSVIVGAVSFAGTEEVLQMTQIINDKQTLLDLSADPYCTYLKSPAGLFTELTLPIDEIISGHEKDTINSAKIVLTQINNSTENEYTLPPPSSILMIPKDSIYSFFENSQSINNRTSFIASSVVGSNNDYTFQNISNLINAMNRNRTSENWNKVVLIPVTIDSGSNRVSHDMALTSAKIAGGPQNAFSPVTISVIYSKFK